MRALITIFEHVLSVFSGAGGWLLACVLYAIGFFQPEKYCFIAVLITMLADMICGIWAQLKLGNFVKSKLLQKTLSKAFVYCLVLCTVYVTELILHDGWMFGIKAVSAVAAACEIWSMSASMLIINPDMPFLKIFRLQLKGEIESKAGKNLDEVLK